MDELSWGWLALLMFLACPLMMIGMGLFAWLAGSRLFGGQGGHGMMCHMMGHGGHHDHQHSEEDRASESGEAAPSGDSPKSV